MTTPYAYIDTSALVRLVVAESGTPALEADLATRPGLLCSALGVTELRRACRRALPKRRLAHVEEVIDALVVIEITPSILVHAADLNPTALRTLDAIHLTTVLSLDETSIEVVTYDDRLARAARAHGLTVVAPGT